MIISILAVKVRGASLKCVTVGEPAPATMVRLTMVIIIMYQTMKLKKRRRKKKGSALVWPTIDWRALRPPAPAYSVAGTSNKCLFSPTAALRCVPFRSVLFAWKFHHDKNRTTAARVDYR